MYLYVPGSTVEQESVVGELVAEVGDAEFEATSDEGPECTFLDADGIKVVVGFCDDLCDTSGCGDTGRGGDAGSGGRSSKTSSSVTLSSPSSTVGSIYENYY